VWAALAYGAALLAPGRSARVRTLTSGLLAAGVAVLVGGWWWVANVVRFGAVQPQVLDPFPVRAFDPDLLAFTEGVVVRLTASTWGSFGWLEVRLPELAQLAGAVVLVLGVSLAVGRRAPAPGARAAAAVALAAFCVQVAVVYQQSLKNYLRGGYFAGLQGRYLFAFVAVLAALVALGLSGLLPRTRQRVAPLAALAAVAVMQVVGVVTALRGFWWADGTGLGRALAVQSAWAPFPPPVLLLALVVGLAALVLLVRSLVTRPPDAPRRAADPVGLGARPAGDAGPRSRPLPAGDARGAP
jgi:hypothetical protein